jgi:DNA-binding GntR family transcriptional regulator
MPRKMTAREIADEIEALIVDGQYPPGAQLPSYRELAEEYGVGRTTISMAMAFLRDRRLVEGAQGQGTFVLGDVGE